ncbi:Lipopolysaccharide 16-galactosyl transferase [Salmonella bongori]|nr:Lipopolysaccharide 16-galactosyl transferase [Salmonella bongori]
MSGVFKFEGQKRIKDLFDGLSRTAGEWQLHIIGDGSDFEKCQAYSRELGIDQRIIWYGWQSAPWEVVQLKVKMPLRYYSPSAFEGFPMTLLEAMSYGIPCISSDCMSGPRDMIKPGLNGELYAPGAIDEFCRIFESSYFRRNKISA